MLTVGQQLWYVPRDQRWEKPRFVTVTKVGRKWADVDSTRVTRVNIKTLIADGGGYQSPGRCYVSQEGYEIEHAADVLWDRLRNRLSLTYRKPYGVTSAEIEKVASLLRLSLETP